MERAKFQGEEFLADYLGDGVYALSDGYGIWLHAGSHEFPTDRVYLEPEVLTKLNNFAKGVKNEFARPSNEF